MDIKVNQFCSIVTSASWQSWLYHYNQTLYGRFMKALHSSKGCSHNREIMIEVLKEIERVGDVGHLYNFLNNEFPHVLVRNDNNDQFGIFKDFIPGILTYPHRRILYSDGEDLNKRVQRFVKDKSIYEYIIIEDRAYIEYLLPEEKHLINEIPDEKWLIKRYKSSII